MNEVAPFAIHAIAVREEDAALFCFVFGVNLLIFPQFVGAVGELALLLVGTEAEFEVFFA